MMLKVNMIREAVLLDTSFFIRLLDEKDPLNKSADEYLKFFLDNEVELMLSAISIAEYCVYGDVTELPMKYLRVIPFNIDHAIKAGEFASVLFEQRKSGATIDRRLIQNDVKLFAQCEILKSVSAFITSDARSRTIFETLRATNLIRFDFVDISTSCNETFGTLGLS